MKLKLSRASIAILVVAFGVAGYGLMSADRDVSKVDIAAVVQKPGSGSEDLAAKPSRVRPASIPDGLVDASNLSARIDLLEARTNQAQQIHDVFAVSVPVPAPPPAAPSAQKPSAPPFPYTFLGAMQDGNIRTLYLTRSDRVVIARSGQDLEGLYHVDSIAGQALTVTYLPLHQQQTIALGRSR